MPKNNNKKDDGEPPDPPPPPPAALVKLLQQKNSKVLIYFQALQANLDYDVQKWKHRARKYQAESLEWKEKAEHLQKHPAENLTHGSAAKRRATKQSNRNESETEEANVEPIAKRMKAAPPPVEKAEHLQKHQAKDLTHGAAKRRATKPSNRDDVEKEEMAAKPVAKVMEAAPPPVAAIAKVDEDADWLDLASSGSDNDFGFLDEQKNQKAAPFVPPMKKNTAPPLNILALSSDSDDTDDEEEDDASTGWLESQLEPTGTSDKSAYRRLQFETRNTALTNLRKAQQLLDRLGVSLVTEKVIPATEKADDAEDSDASSPLPERPKVVLERRPDQAVVFDLLQVIKAMVRIRVNCKIDDNHVTLNPFMTDQLLPCFVSDPSGAADSPPHPAVEGFRSISDALCLMDAHCPMLEDPLIMEDPNHQEDSSNKEAWYEKLVLGMKDRHRMVNGLLQSLEGETAQLWPAQDRSTRLITTSVHFQPTSDLDGDSKVTSTDAISFAAKNMLRLATLCERCFLVRVVTRLHISRQDPKSTFQCFWKYLLATTPAMAASLSPAKLPPVQSICVLESMLQCGAHGDSNSSFPPIPSFLFKWMSRVIRLVVDATASIYTVRSTSADDRIADVARVELRAKARLVANCRFWADDQKALSTTIAGANTNMDEISSIAAAVIQEILQVSNEETDVKDGYMSTLLPLLLELLLILKGDTDYLDKLFLDILAKYTKKPECTKTYCHLFACVRAKKQLEIRHLNTHRQVVGSPSTVVAGGKPLWDYTTTMWEVFKSSHDIALNDSFSADFVRMVLSTCMALADLEIAVKVANWFWSHANARSIEGTSLPSILNMMETIGQVVTVKIINLERRPDRMAHFLSQAVHHGVMVMRSVSDINQLKGDGDEIREHSLGGCYAFDGGQGRPAEVELRLSRQVGCDQEGLNSLVETHWRPNDLRAFDTEAPNSLDLVRISSSEKACALSHIASWKGVSRTLRWAPANASGVDEDVVFRDHGHLHRKFHIGGYARGPALFPENEGMDPAPVCVILEDDAILVDRFADRLERVLAELPRDFHFCSLGYGRPKTAPMIPFSTEIGIPSCIWYLTGYIVSLDGASYLLHKLPVRGPVDSWIGLNMFGNWDNMYGHAMGVGMAANPSNETSISRKDLRSLLQFRAFAALVPLCSQKVGATSASSNKNTGRNWRQRDTDIIYSGNSK